MVALPTATRQPIATAPIPSTTVAPSVPAEIEKFAVLILEDADHEAYVNRHISDFLPKGFLSKRRRKNRDVAFNTYYFNKVHVTGYTAPFVLARCFNTHSSPTPVVRDVVIKIAREDDHFVVIPPEPENIDWDNENVYIPLYWRISELRALTLEDRQALESQVKD